LRRLHTIWITPTIRNKTTIKSIRTPPPETKYNNNKTKKDKMKRTKGKEE
jgi:hypothetical protein